MTVASPTNCIEVNGNLEFTNCRAVLEENYIEIIVASSIEVDWAGSRNYQITIDNAVNLPMTTVLVDPIELATSGNEIAIQTYRAQKGQLVASLDPTSDVVGADTTLVMSVTATHAIPADGKLVLEVSEPWNEGSPSLPISYFSSVGCTEILVGQATVDGTCTFLNDHLELEDAFPNGVPAGAQIIITIIGFRNPALMNRDYNVFTVKSTGSDIEDLVDTLEVSVRVTTPANLGLQYFQVSERQTVDIGIVQEKNVMQVEYISPVPFQPNCEVSYWFPQAFYDASTIEEIVTGDLLGSVLKIYLPGAEATQNTFVVAEEEEGHFKSITFKACETYRSSDPIEITQIIGMSQPFSTEPSESLRIYIRDYSGELTVQSEEGFSFTPMAGDLRYQTIVVSPTTVQAEAEIEVQFQAQHQLPLGRDAAVSVIFPDDFSVLESCEATYGDVVVDCTTNEIQNSVLIGGFLNEEYPGYYELLVLKVKPIKLPYGLNGGQGDIKIVTLLNDFPVDEGEGQGGLILTPGTFQQASVATESLTALAKTEYYFSFQPQHQIPKMGFIMIEYPPEVEIADPSLSQSLCDDWQSFTSESAVCSVFGANRTILITKGFSAGTSVRDDTFSFTLPYVTNPIGLEETSTFRFTTFSESLGIVDTYTGPTTVQMEHAAILNTYELVMSTSQNSMPDQLSFTLVSEVPLTNVAIIEINLPQEVTIDETCQASTELPIATQMLCSVNGQSLRLTMNLDGTIEPLDTFLITIDGVTNPPTTKPTGGISMRILDDGAVNLLTESGNDLRIVTYVPYDIPASLVADQTGAGLLAEYTLEFQIVHDLNPDGGIMIQYPPEVELSEFALTAVVDGSQYGLDLSAAVPEIDMSARQILFQHLFVVGLAADEESRLVVIINGLKNPLNNRESASFEFTSFNEEENILYLVDQVVSGLILRPLCNFPCQTCFEGQPDWCLSCFSDSILPYLQGGTCLKQCSADYFYDLTGEPGECLECDPNCLTCEGDSRHCTSCGGNEHPLLKGDVCVADCGIGYVDDPRNNICEPCLEGCASCSIAFDNCTSCIVDSPTPALFDYTCYEKCPLKISIPDRDIITCLPCDEECETCAGRPNVCTSCPEFMLFDAQRLECSQSCKPGAQIYNDYLHTCESCQFNCLTCVDDVDYCTSCKEGFLLNLDHACREECEGPAGQSIVNGVCKECQEPCAECGEYTDLCTKCHGDMLLHKTTCVEVCPDKYEANGEEPNRCMLVGLQCPLGFEVNRGGDGCVPVVFECEQGYEINPAGTACVPVPGTPIPFPFLFVTICAGILVAGSYMKEKQSTKVKTCLIWMIGVLEPIMYGLMTGYAIDEGQKVAAVFAGLGLGVLLLINMAFYYNISKKLAKDEDYIEWCRLYPRGACLMPVFALLNFKSVRFSYSGFFSWDIAEASFTDAIQNVHSPLVMATHASYVFTYLPELVSAFSILHKVESGHQVFVLAIEVVLLQLLVIYLTYKEFQTDPQTEIYKDLDKEYLALKPRKKGGPLVMSAFEEVDDIDEDHLVRVEKTLFPRECQLRKQVLQKIIKQVGGEFLERENVNKALTQNANPKKLRRSDSCGNFGRMGETAVELNESEDSEDIVPLTRRASYPNLDEIIRDQDFVDEVSRIREAFEDVHIDNCYAEAKEPMTESQHMRKKKHLSRRTQTYLRELLWIPGEENMEADQVLVLDESPELDNLFAPNMIAGVIDRLSMSSAETVPKKLPREPSMPEFELEEIMGEFDLDDEGNYIIMEGPNGLIDKNDRPVNRRGYLSDPRGNVITRLGRVVFKAKDLDSDDEIPAKFVFEKRKANLVTIQQQEEMKIQDFGNGEGDEHDDQMTALHADDVTDQNIDDLLNLITKKVVPEKYHNFNVNSSKESKAADSNRLKGDAEAQKMAHAIGNMANQLAESQSQQPRFLENISSRKSGLQIPTDRSSIEFANYADQLSKRPNQRKQGYNQGKQRIFSGDARLRDLAEVYADAHNDGKYASTSSYIKRPKTAKKSSKQSELPSQFVQKTLVADTLDRLQNDPAFGSVDVTAQIGNGLQAQGSQEFVNRRSTEEQDKAE